MTNNKKITSHKFPMYNITTTSSKTIYFILSVTYRTVITFSFITANEFSFPKSNISTSKRDSVFFIYIFAPRTKYLSLTLIMHFKLTLKNVVMFLKKKFLSLIFFSSYRRCQCNSYINFLSQCSGTYQTKKKNYEKKKVPITSQIFKHLFYLYFFPLSPKTLS